MFKLSMVVFCAFMAISFQEGNAKQVKSEITKNSLSMELGSAIRYGDVKQVEVLLRTVDNIDDISFGEFTALQYACYPFHENKQAQREILNLILSKKPNLNKVGFGNWQGTHEMHSDWQPLMLAYAFTSPEFISDLKNAGAQLSLPLSLFASVQNKNAGVTRDLLAAGADVNAKVRMYGYPDQTPLMVSSNENVDLLLAAGANPNLLDRSSNSALILASQRRFYTEPLNGESFNSLIKAGAKLDHQNDKGNTALIVAVKNKRPEFVDILLSSGASVEIKNNEKLTALYINSDIAAYHPNSGSWQVAASIEIAKLLLKYGAKAESALLAHIFYLPDTEYVKVLLDSGVNVNVVSTSKSTPLMYAMDNNNCPDSEISRLLINYGADVNYRNEYLSVLDLGAKSGNIEKLKILHHAGVNLDAQDPVDGHTALMFVAGWRKYESVKFLINAGAKINLKDSEGKTALDHAGDDSAIVKLIIKAGGLPGSSLP